MSAQQGAGAGRLEAEQVRSMFDRIARIYDPLNTAMTAGLHHRWRERAADLAHVGPGSRVLDVATGTGDLAIELARRVAPGGEVVGSDFSEGMLARARVKAARISGHDRAEAGLNGAGGSQNGQAHTGGLVRPRFDWGDALELPYAENSFDAVTVGFGARNFSDLPRGLAEMARVVRPGGRVVVLEFTTPTRPPLSLFYRLWFDRVVPLLGRLVGDADAYAYLPDSVKRWPPPALLAAELARAGLGDIRYLLTAGGILAIHVGTVPVRGDGEGRS
ncbi:MAG TPA: class I SAM-dependent methyltransferase [Solirubrobacteraceae bacterium]|jgi:demethylmenaquinone methyltransferase/2-methoxy-6-polyprenyl-1,4-benzoquinol methylase